MAEKKGSNKKKLPKKVEENKPQRKKRSCSNESAIALQRVAKQKSSVKEVQLDSNAPNAAQFITIDNIEVVNQGAYESFMSLSSNPWITERRYYKCQNDPLLSIDLLARKTELRKFISHLPEEEQNFIWAIKHIVERAYLKLTKYKQIALGQEAWVTSFQKSHIDDLLILENRKADMLALFGRMYSAEEVHRIITQEWNVFVSIHAIENFRTKNLDKIIELQKDYTNNFSDVRLGYKKSRLEEYMWLYNETKQQYENTRSKDDRKFLKELLESIKREVEGDLIRIEGDLQVNIEHTLNVHVQREIYAKLPINEMILTRIAMKTGVNPLLLLYRLQNSYYSRFTGFLPRAENDTLTLPEYPSSQVYDLDKLQQQNASVSAQDGMRRDSFNNFMKISEERKESSKNLKQILAEKLKQRQQDLDRGIANINEK
jgi:hypothetical protein